jgi:alpha-tubulin suppressor-like RCC1 family protein
MMLSTREVLSDKKGLAAALGMTMIGFAMLMAAAIMVANFAVTSRQSSQLQTLSQEITNRAERYAAQLNTDLMVPAVPATSRACTTTPAMCTAILSVTPSADGAHTVLRVQGDTVSGLGQTLVKDVTLDSNEVTHVTALNSTGEKIWALSDEGLRYKVWGLAAGNPTTLKPEDLVGPHVEVKWVSVQDRAGIDSTGSLWVWGKNNIGQAGIGSTNVNPIKPKKFEGASDFRFVLTVDDRGYAIDAKGNLWTWGKNGKGQLGLGHSNNVMTPTKVPGLRMMTVTAGKDNFFGITTSGELVMAGAAQAGLPAPTGFAIKKLNVGTQYRDISASIEGALAMIDKSGNLTMVGNDYTFPAMAGNYTSVSLGSHSGYALGSTGSLYSWGENGDGQLGLGHNDNPTVRTQVKAGTLFSAVVGAKTSAFAIDVSGNLYYFGKSPSGSVGAPELPQVNVPTKLLAESKFRGISANSNSTVGAFLDTNGNLYGLGTPTAGLWPITYNGDGNQPIRMPVPAGFPSFTWE